ncbi:hypothetical protein Vretifemale_12152 [Volvox reticuliferus]|uniref:Aminotransferase class I/classII large domain-containing protein n=1 Tax=Volvox reticuliferus TaxID=1737510 RepID=A0A8J4CK64_9CHLO|nr:hypothetical protein Vretifemale_12152 [Volvox reticuliferus]
MDYSRFLSAEAKRFTNASLAGLVHRFAGVDGVISLAAGLPPAEAFPVTELTARTADGQDVTLGSEGRQAYLAQQYNFNPQGYDPLLNWLRNLTVKLHGVNIANASAQSPKVAKKEPVALAGGPGGDTAAAVAVTAAAPVRAEAVAVGGTNNDRGATAAAPAGPNAAEPAAVSVAATTQAALGAPVRDLVLTSGAIHAIFAIISCLTDPGDTLVVDEYTYTHALECVFLPRGLRLLPVRGDREGLDPEDLDLQLQLATAEVAAGRGACRRPRLLYTIPTGHNPTGVVMGEDRKRRILEVCETHDLLVLEDDAYYWLYYPYEGESGGTAGEEEGRGGITSSAPGRGRVPGLEGLPASLLHLDTRGRVIRVDTFSKLLGPGYRLGWITAPRPLVAKLANWVQASTVGPCSVTQVCTCDWRVYVCALHVTGVCMCVRGGIDKQRTWGTSALPIIAGRKGWEGGSSGRELFFYMAGKGEETESVYVCVCICAGIVLRGQSYIY